MIYTPAFDALLAQPRLSPLGPGTANENVRPQLAALTLESAFAPQRVQDRDMATCCIAALWLYHDFLDASHELSQEIATREGSYWHAILHRREPDFGNAKYWFRRVGRHPIFIALQERAAALAAQRRLDRHAAYLVDQAEWDPFTFVDLCEAAYHGRSPLEQLCRQIQQEEWMLLFGYCFRHAVD